jgi:hypothetical protein
MDEVEQADELGRRIRSRRQAEKRGSSFDEGQRPSHGSRCDHQYDRGCEHQT